MAKMFYTSWEAAKELGVSEDHLHLLSQQNLLREFRDGALCMYKVDQVDALADANALTKFSVTPELPLPVQRPQISPQLSMFVTGLIIGSILGTTLTAMILCFVWNK